MDEHPAECEGMEGGGDGFSLEVFQFEGPKVKPNVPINHWLSTSTYKKACLILNIQ